ncbi:MAG: hypothetical protein ACTSWY_04085 [Promethearchaeota archaeon]
MVSSNVIKHKNSGIFKSLKTFSNPDRMDVFKIINEFGGKIQFKTILDKKYHGSIDKSSSLSSHLRKLRKIGMIDKDSSGYFITLLGKEFAENINDMECIFSNHNEELIVRTSGFYLEHFKEEKIVEFLIREAKLGKTEAQNIAENVKKRLNNANINYLTAPMIRELLCVVCLEMGYEDTRHLLTRLGVPSNDIAYLTESAGFSNLNELFKELGQQVLEQYLLLSLLPQGNADYYLSGKLFFLHPASWGQIPLELILSGKKFAKIVIRKIIGVQNKGNTVDFENNEKIRIFTNVIRDLFTELKDFFSGGVLITEFEQSIKEFSSFLEISTIQSVKYMFSSFPEINLSIAHDPRNFHNINWELWLEITLVEEGNYSKEINAIINEYYSDYLQIKKVDLSKKLSSNDKKTLNDIFQRKPNLLISIPPEVKEVFIKNKEPGLISPIIIKAVESSLYHSISFIYQNVFSKKEKRLKKNVLTPSMTPILLEIPESDGRELNYRSKIVLDKIFINLPKILQISEGISDFRPLNTSNKKSTINEVKTEKKGKRIKNQEKFFDVLKTWVYNAMNLFDRKFVIMSENINLFNNWESLSELLFNGNFLTGKGDIFEYKGNVEIVCSICLNGLVEVTRYFTGLYPDQNEDAFSFLTKIISFVSDLLKNNSKHPFIVYTLSQSHLDNYLQVRFNQDSYLLQNMSEEFLDSKYHKALVDYNNSKKSKSKEQIASNKYSITKFMGIQNNGDLVSENFPYLWSVFRFEMSKSLNKILGLFNDFQICSNDPVYFDLFLDKHAGNILSAEILDIFKSIFKNNIKNFGFSRIIRGENSKNFGTNKTYIRYGGCYKPLNYFGKLIQNKVLNRKDSIL